MNSGILDTNMSTFSDLPEPEAAVGIIACSRPEESVLLIKRNENEHDPWSGHYAFPGGRRENGDSTIYQTWETARAGRNVKAPILVQPYVFRLDDRPVVIIEEKEIASHVWLSVDSFMDCTNHRIVEIRPDMIRPVFPMDDYYIWGFTYGLICRLLGFDQRTVPR